MNTRTLGVAALLAALSIAPATLAQTAAPERQAKAQPKAARATHAHPVVSRPWWVRTGTIRVMGPGSSGTASVSGHEGGVSAGRTFTGRTGKAAMTVHSVTHDGTSVTHEHTTTLPDGRTIERETTLTKDGDTVTRDAQTTGPDGKSAVSTTVWTRESGTVTREHAVVTPSGNTRESTTTWTDGERTVERPTTHGRRKAIPLHDARPASKAPKAGPGVVRRR